MEKILPLTRCNPDAASSLPVATSGAEPVFVCDAEEQRGVLRLKRGRWAGRTWAARLRCCDNPFCNCAYVHFHCCLADGESPDRPEVMHFVLDPIERVIAPDKDENKHPDAPELAMAVVAELGEEEWRCVYRFLLTTKRDIVQTMDVNRLPVSDSPYYITENGSMVGFAEIFPFAECFEFDLDGEQWVIDDQYCVAPDCRCREVVLSFLPIVPSPDGSNTVREPTAVARYDYRRNKVRPERKPAAGKPSLNILMQAARKAHPSLLEDIKWRHNQLKMLYLRTLDSAARQRFSPGESVTRTAPQVGRNESCPCGSGKKYKKCCGC